MNKIAFSIEHVNCSDKLIFINRSLTITTKEKKTRKEKMKMIMNSKKVLGIVLFIGLVASNSFAAEIANVFRYPVGDEIGNGWLNNRGGLQWLEVWDYQGNCGIVYHPGIDFNKDGTSGDQDRYEPVYAIANGEVIESYYESGSSWGNLILIRHILLNGEVVFSLYGHLDTRMVSVGDLVTIGQQIGTVGKGIGLNAHLHSEIRKSSLADRSAKFFPCGNSGYNEAFVIRNYFNTEAFVKIGRFANMSSEITLKFVERYELKIGVPYDNGGTIYVHRWPEQGNEYVLIQDFLNEDENNRYGTDGQTALIYNPSTQRCYLVKEGFWGYYKQNNGPITLGPPFTDEIRARLAVSPNGVHTALGIVGTTVVGQKFGDPDGTRQTLMYSTATGYLGHLPMGLFHIGESNQSGEQWYVMVDNNPANDLPWPIANQPAPTGDWWTAAGVYQFCMHNPDGSRRGGVGVSVTIGEGNNQFISPESPSVPTATPAPTFTPTPLQHSWYVGTHATSQGVQENSPYDPIRGSHIISPHYSGYLLLDAGGQRQWLSACPLRMYKSHKSIKTSK